MSEAPRYFFSLFWGPYWHVSLKCMYEKKKKIQAREEDHFSFKYTPVLRSITLCGCWVQQGLVSWHKTTKVSSTDQYFTQPLGNTLLVRICMAPGQASDVLWVRFCSRQSFPSDIFPINCDRPRVMATTGSKMKNIWTIECPLPYLSLQWRHITQVVGAAW